MHAMLSPISECLGAAIWALCIKLRAAGRPCYAGMLSHSPDLAYRPDSSLLLVPQVAFWKVA